MCFNEPTVFDMITNIDVADSRGNLIGGPQQTSYIDSTRMSCAATLITKIQTINKTSIYLHRRHNWE